MSLFSTLLTSIPTCYATVSIGSDSNPLKQKLEVIAAAGFQGTDFHPKDVAAHDFERLCDAGKEVKGLCEKLGLEIVMLQPFANFEGWETQSK